MSAGEGGGDDPHGTFAGHPEHGVRIELVLEEREGARATYQGFAFTHEARHVLVVVAELEGARATLAGDDKPANAAAIEKAAAALVRAATRAELEEGVAVPRKIVRWRSV